MRSVRKLRERVQGLFGGLAEKAATESGVIQRRRVFTGTTLASTFLLAFLKNPHAGRRELAEASALVGAPVSPQAIDQRWTPELTEFFKRLFYEAIRTPLTSDRTAAALLERFRDVEILDSTTLSLPDEEASEYPGCGGSSGAGLAAMKLQVRMSLKTGALTAVRIEAGRDCDVKTPLQRDIPAAGTLIIKDLGYFDGGVLRQLGEAGSHWLSPLEMGSNVYDVEGEPIDLVPWLEAHGPVIDCEIRIGSQHQVGARLIAWRLPEERANVRRQRVYQECKRKGRTPSAERLRRCDWATLVTNLPAGELSISEARVLYRARWQIELLFKRWKSQGCVDELTGSTEPQTMTCLWIRLLVAILQQWLQTGVWGRPDISLKKTWDAFRNHAWLIAMAVHDAVQLTRVLQTLYDLIEKTIRRGKRKRAGTFELLNDPTKLDYALP